VDGGNAAQSAASAAFSPDPVRVARPEHLLPEDHVADEHVFLRHCEEAAQVALGEIELARAPASHGSSAPSSQETSGLPPVFVSSAGRAHSHPYLVRSLSGAARCDSSYGPG